MTTVKEFKDLDGKFVVGDKIEGLGFDADHIISFAWRPYSTLPSNPKFKYETWASPFGWRPLLDQPKKSAYDVGAHVSGEFNQQMVYGDNKPVFTQAMAERGELPPVGSRFLYCMLANPKETDWSEVESKYADDECMFFKGNNGNKGFVNKEDMTYPICKPVDTRTPKQKAVDAVLAEWPVADKASLEVAYDIWKC